MKHLTLAALMLLTITAPVQAFNPWHCMPNIHSDDNAPAKVKAKNDLLRSVAWLAIYGAVKNYLPGARANIRLWDQPLQFFGMHVDIAVPFRAYYAAGGLSAFYAGKALYNYSEAEKLAQASPVKKLAAKGKRLYKKTKTFLTA